FHLKYVFEQRRLLGLRFADNSLPKYLESSAFHSLLSARWGLYIDVLCGERDLKIYSQAVGLPLHRAQTPGSCYLLCIEYARTILLPDLNRDYGQKIPHHTPEKTVDLYPPVHRSGRQRVLQLFYRAECASVFPVLVRNAQ